MINVSKLLPKTIVVLGVFYYYTAAFSPLIGKKILYPVFILAVLACLVFALNQILSGRLSSSQYKFLILSMCLLVISYVLKWPNVSWIILMSIPLIKLSLDEYIKLIFYISSMLFILVIIFAITGRLPLEYINFAGETEVRFGLIKYSLGFDGPNQAALAFFPILTSGLYTYGGNKAFIYIMFLITLVLGILTGSRTGMLIGLALIVSYVAIGKRERKNASESKSKSILKLLPYLFVIFTALTIIITIKYSGNAVANELLTYRPSLIYGYINSSYIPTLTGSNEVYNKAQYGTPPLDNHPIYILAKYGLVGYCLFAAIYILGTKRLGSWRLRTILLFTMIYGLFEAFFDIPVKNYMLPILLYVLFVAKNEVKYEK